MLVTLANIDECTHVAFVSKKGSGELMRARPQGASVLRQTRLEISRRSLNTTNSLKSIDTHDAVLVDRLNIWIGAKSVQSGAVKLS